MAAVGGLNEKFFKKAKKVGRNIVITDNEAIIPAVGDSPETRVALPTRRMKTIEERQAAIDARVAEISALDEEIEAERVTLMDRVESFKNLRTGAADVVIQNQKIRMLMEKRSALARPVVWIEELGGLTAVDILENKTDKRSLGHDVYQLTRRVEPITSLYVDVGGAAAAAQAAAEAEAEGILQGAAAGEAAKAAAAEKAAVAATALAAPPTGEEAAKTGAIIGAAKVKRTMKIKKTAAGVGAPGV
jgi:hypothetical protein